MPLVLIPQMNMNCEYEFELRVYVSTHALNFSFLWALKTMTQPPINCTFPSNVFE
jgi:hypothetical protein